MSEFKKYVRKGHAEMRPYLPSDAQDLGTKISISEADTKLECLFGGMIARNPENHDDQWYVAQEWFEENYVSA